MRQVIAGLTIISCVTLGGCGESEPQCEDAADYLAEFKKQKADETTDKAVLYDLYQESLAAC